jgi:predicted Zn finger-like uncharacterized protein
MSLITRCPACETLFKVVPDQLRISGGWVRCGQCDEVFDASLHLLQAPPAEALPVARHDELAENFETTASTDVTVPPVEIDLNSGGLASPDELPVEPQQVLPDPADDETERALPESIPDEFSPLDEVISLPMGLPDTQTEVSQSDPSEAALPGQVAYPDRDDPEAELRAELSDVSFLRDKRHGSFWHKPFMRATLVFLSLALLLGLSGQLVFHERDRIVALEPGLKPWLLAMCAPLNCTLSPLRRIESIVIDSASFTKVRGDIYRLNFTVKNTAVIALAAPAIELTLTDSLDQSVVRRVFIPTELGGHPDTLVAGAEWPASLAMVVKAAGTADRVVGYRLLAFYP